MDELLDKPARRILGESRRCIATNRAGERCGRAAIVGGFVCAFHGGNTPTARAAAKRRQQEALRSLVEPALAAAARFLEPPTAPCEVCGRSDNDHDPAILRAAQLILDRTGFHPTLTVQRAQEEYEPWVEYLTDEECEAMSVFIENAERRMALGDMPQKREPLALPPAIEVDAVLVEEEGEPEVEES